MSKLEEPTNEASAMQKEISVIAEQGGGTTKVEQLIQQYCPDGVEYKRLGDVCLMERGTSATKGTMQEGDIPVISGGRQPAFYCSQSNREGETITVAGSGAGAGYVQYWDKPIFVCDAFSIKGNDSLNTKFIYYFLSSIQEKIYATKKGGGVPHVHISSIDKFEIPVPPLPVQEEIVRILDTLTELQAELQAELQKRKQQYEYYRDKLLSFSDLGNWGGRNVSVEWKKLGEIGKVCMCKRILKEQTFSTGDIPFFKIGTFGGSADAYISKELFDEYVKKYSYPKKGDILISAAGTIGRTVVFDGSPSYFQDSNIVWLKHDESVVLNSYLRYIYSLNPWAISTGGTIARLYNDNILNAVIPVPPLAEQQRIVDILDRFDTLTTDITAGLPAEIEARRKQYEYYRDKLLTFKKK